MPSFRALYNRSVQRSRIKRVPAIIDSSHHQEPGRGRRGGLLFSAIVFGVFVAGRFALSYWVDLLWFRSLGYGEVFGKAVGLQAGIFVAFAAITFLLLYGVFSVIRRSHEA